VGSGAGAQPDEDGSVDQDAAEHANKDPEVVKPKTLVLVGVVDPTLLTKLV
jgi:hypothetical protein